MTAIGITKLTDLQYRLLEGIQSKRDVSCAIREGGGKTVACLLGAIGVVDFKKLMPQVLVINPTREVCKWTSEKLDSMNYNKLMKSVLVVGGVTIREQIEGIRAGCNIICGICGRMLDLIEREVFKTEMIKLVVFYELSDQLDMGFSASIVSIISKLQYSCQILFSSSHKTDIILKLEQSFLTNPVQIMEKLTCTVQPSLITYIWYKAIPEFS